MGALLRVRGALAPLLAGEDAAPYRETRQTCRVRKEAMRSNYAPIIEDVSYYMRFPDRLLRVEAEMVDRVDGMFGSGAGLAKPPSDY